MMVMAESRFWNVFKGKPIIGMIHLSGRNPVQRALDELDIYEEQGLDGAIIENYHGSVGDVSDALKEIGKRRYLLSIGVNILPNEFDEAFKLAGEYKAEFIQLDHVAGSYTSGTLKYESYRKFREEFSDVAVLGGVWPKYYIPVKGSNLEKDLKDGTERADAIVVTGKATGSETPLDKIMKFRETIGKHPLVVGAGTNPDNISEQLRIADGVIVGSCFKAGGDTSLPVEKHLVERFMKEARK